MITRAEEIKDLEEELKDCQDTLLHAYQDEANAQKNRISAERAVTEAQLKLDALRDEELENESGRLSYNDKAES